MLVGSVQEAIQKVGGKLNKLTVAVVLNSYSPAAANTDIEGLKETVANAAGTTVDNVSIQQMAFSSAVPASSSEPSSRRMPSLGPQALYIVIAAALLLIAVLSLVLVLLRQRRKKRELEMQQALEAAKEEAQKQLEETKPETPEIKSIEETIAETEKNSYKKEIEKFADQKPELVAQILKNWLKD